MPELKRRRREAAEEAAARRRRQREEAAAEAAATEGEAQGAPIDASNIGAQMLQNMGWNSTRGLGKAEDGIRAPITVCALSLLSLLCALLFTCSVCGRLLRMRIVQGLVLHQQRQQQQQQGWWTSEGSCVLELHNCCGQAKQKEKHKGDGYMSSSFQMMRWRRDAQGV